MAAKESSDDVFANMEILTEQVQQLVSHRLETSVHTLCAKAIEKRKRKWRRKHQAVNGDDSASDIHEAPKVDEHRTELEGLLSACWDQQMQLSSMRREGLETVRRLRVEKWDHCLQAIRYRLTHTRLSLEGLGEEQVSPTQPTQTPVQNILEHQTLLELQAAIARAKSLQAIRNMKLHETPRVPSLSRDEVSQQDPPEHQHTADSTPSDSPSNLPSPAPPTSITLGTSSLPDRIEDSIDCNNNCNIPVVMTTEVSTTSLHPDDIVPPEEPLSVPITYITTDVSTTPHEIVPPNEALSMPISFMPPEPTLTPYLTETDFHQTLDTDTPLHVGMEVICHGESLASSITEDSDIMVESSGGVAHIPTHCDTPQPPETKKSRTPASKTRRRSKIGVHRKRHGKGATKSPTPTLPLPSPTSTLPLPIENGVVSEDGKRPEVSDTDTDSDSQMRKLLEVLERAPYNLRVPQKNSGDTERYSFTNGVTVTASVKRKRRKSSTPRQK